MIEYLISLMIAAIPKFDDYFPNPSYPSGVMGSEKDNYSLYNDQVNRKPSSSNPVLRLTMPVYDYKGSQVKPGMYEIIFLEKENRLGLIQSGEIIAKLPIVQKISLSKKIVLPEAKFEILNSEQLMIIYKNQNIEAESVLEY